jgi:hypothetical protein
MDRLRRREDRGVERGHHGYHAHQFAALDAALIRAFGHRVAAGMVRDGFLAVTIVHGGLGHGGVCSQRRANGGESHCNRNQDGEKQPVHDPYLLPQATGRQLTPPKS